MKIRLHSDDLGATPSVTTRMLDCWQRGVLDGFSIMANGTAGGLVQSALQAEAARPAFVVAHLNLSEGPSTLPPTEVPLLVDARGELRHGYGSLLRLWLFGGRKTRAALCHQVRCEWQAQIERVATLVAPRAIDGVDGHVHVHMLPFLFPIAAALAVEQGIASIRVTHEPLHCARGLWELLRPALAINLLKHVVLRVCARWAWPVVKATGLQAPQRVLGVLYSGQMTADAALAGLAAAQRAGVDSVEAIFHVGRAQENEVERWRGRPGIAAFNLDPQRDHEFNAVAICRARLREDGLVSE